ncbi:PREDICTED: transcription factor bHLH25-like [Ipomoea nil]|uniref:transcription factor bHLH25-like n=1 Tax=Ipomoea nil TaxID=35883 RepID=UPI0009015EDB|nr:PREDICTED: transcription factor bHLH25-like [Ipomoea nil]
MASSFEDSSVLQGWFLDLEEDDECYNLGSHLQENSSFDDFAAHNSFITQEENNNIVQRSESPESYTSGYSIFMPNANNGNITRTATISFAGGFQFQADQFEERPPPPLKQIKGDDYTNKKLPTSSSSTLHHNLVSGVNKGRERTHLSQDHILAERKRREKLNRKFIALSAILPGLKKSDKASVLEEAIRYLKELQENVKHLEQARNTRLEKTVLKRRKVISPGDDLSEQGHDCSDVDDDKTAPEIEVRFSEKSALIRVHSPERIPSLSTFLREIESLQLTILNSSAMPFGKNATDITLVAQMEEGFCMTTNDVVKHLQRSMNPTI